MSGWWPRPDVRGVPRRAERLAVALWAIFALVVWNVVYDRLLVLAGRRFVHDAAVASATGQPFLLAGPWMRAASDQALRTATWAAVAILVVGGSAIALAARRDALARRRLRCRPPARPVTHPTHAARATD